MFGSVIAPAPNDLAGALGIMRVLSDPVEAKKMLNDIIGATEQLKIQQEELNKVRVELQDKEQDLKTKLDLFAGDKQLTDNYANALDDIKADLDKREADLQAREQNVAIVENSQRENDDRIRSKEQRAISKLNELQQRESDLNTKHSKVDETQSKLDKHLARIQSVLQP